MGEDLDGLSDLTSEFVGGSEDESSRLEDRTVARRRRRRSKFPGSEIWVRRWSSSEGHGLKEVGFDVTLFDPRRRDVLTCWFGRLEGFDDGESVRDRLS